MKLMHVGHSSTLDPNKQRYWQQLQEYLRKLQILTILKNHDKAIIKFQEMFLKTVKVGVFLVW